MNIIRLAIIKNIIKARLDFIDIIIITIKRYYY